MKCVLRFIPGFGLARINGQTVLTEHATVVRSPKVKNASYCAEELDVSCEVGCRAFFSRNENDTARLRRHFGQVWGPRIDGATFCNGQQASAAYCRIGAARPRARRCERRPRDLLKPGQPDGRYIQDTEARAQALLAKTRALVAAPLTGTRPAPLPGAQ